MPDLTMPQRQAMIALEDGSLPVEIFNAMHDDPSVALLIPSMIEIGRRGTADLGETASLTQEGHVALLAARRASSVAQAAGMAGQMIDFLGDQSASSEDRKERKSILLRGQLDLQTIRHDVKGSKG